MFIIQSGSFSGELAGGKEVLPECALRGVLATH